MTDSRDSFAALEHIEDGDWDKWLHRLHGAIHQRQQTKEYKSTLIVGAEDDIPFPDSIELP